MASDSYREQQVRFWKRLACLLDAGVSAVQSLSAIAAETEEAGLRETVERLIQQINSGRRLSEAMADLPDRFAASTVTIVKAGEAGGVLDVICKRIASAMKEGVFPASTIGQRRDELDAESEQIVEFVMDIIVSAIDARASDIHLEPMADGGRVRLRIDGLLHPARQLGSEMYEAVISRLKIMSGVDVLGGLRPQDGRMFLSIRGKLRRLHASFGPYVRGHSTASCAVIRVIEEDRALFGRGGLEHLGLSASQAERVMGWCKRRRGLVVCTGPRGEGKTTIIYNLIAALNDVSVNISTVESPVEYSIEGVNQMQVRPQIGLTFPQCIRALGQQALEVLLIGELRDTESAELAVRAAITGQLVLTCLHTENATQAIQRLTDMGIPWWLVRDTLAGVVAPRLIRQLCGNCKEKAAPDRALVARLGLTDEVAAASYFRAVGCEECHHTGYVGRTGVFEVFEPRALVWEAVGREAGADEVRGVAQAEGLSTLRDEAVAMAGRGDTSLEEVARVAPEERWLAEH